MRILEINTLLPKNKNSGGAEKFLLELSLNLKNKRQYVDIASGSTTNSIQGIKNHYLSKINNKILRKLFFDYYNPMAVKGLEKAINNFKPDIVHFHNVYGISSYLIRIISQKIPTVVTGHDYWPFCYFSTLTINKMSCPDCLRYSNIKTPLRSMLHNIHKKINYQNYRNSTIVAPSNFMAKKLKTIGNFDNVLTIQNGIDLPDKMTSYNKKILWVGRISKEKGLQVILPILNEIAQKNEWEVNIIGEGPLKDKLSQKYQFVNFCGYQDPSDYYLKSSILVFSSIWPENLPYTILEAMSYGLCVIAPKIGGIPEIIIDNRNGFLLNNLDDIEKKLLDVINKPFVIRKMGLQARYDVFNKYNWDIITKKYIGLFKQMVVSKQTS